MIKAQTELDLIQKITIKYHQFIHMAFQFKTTQSRDIAVDFLLNNCVCFNHRIEGETLYFGDFPLPKVVNATNFHDFVKQFDFKCMTSCGLIAIFDTSLILTLDHMVSDGPYVIELLNGIIRTIRGETVTLCKNLCPSAWNTFEREAATLTNTPYALLAMRRSANPQSNSIKTQFLEKYVAKKFSKPNQRLAVAFNLAIHKHNGIQHLPNQMVVGSSTTVDARPYLPEESKSAGQHQYFCFMNMRYSDTYDTSSTIGDIITQLNSKMKQVISEKGFLQWQTRILNRISLTDGAILSISNAGIFPTSEQLVNVDVLVTGDLDSIWYQLCSVNDQYLIKIFYPEIHFGVGEVEQLFADGLSLFENMDDTLSLIETYNKLINQ